MLTEKNDINTILSSHFNSLGKHPTTDPLMYDDIKVFLSSIENSVITPSSPIQVKFDSGKISKIVNEVKAGKACGIDKIPNELLQFGSQTLITSLIDLSTLISDLETVPDDWQIGIIKSLNKKMVPCMILIITGVLPYHQAYTRYIRKS